jgi:hypothetical protein
MAPIPAASILDTQSCDYPLISLLHGHAVQGFHAEILFSFYIWFMIIRIHLRILANEGVIKRGSLWQIFSRIPSVNEGARIIYQK